MKKLTQTETTEAAKKLELPTQHEVLKWDTEKLSSWLYLASSFGLEDVVIDMFTRLNPSR